MRLRTGRYSANLYSDITKTVVAIGPDGEEEEIDDPEELTKIYIGKVPIMLRSVYCCLSEHNERELVELGECPYDQGGYFIINGSEKVGPLRRPLLIRHALPCPRLLALHLLLLAIRFILSFLHEVARGAFLRLAFLDTFSAHGRPPPFPSAPRGLHRLSLRCRFMTRLELISSCSLFHL